MMMKEVLKKVLPNAKVRESKKELEVVLPNGFVGHFSVVSDPHDVAEVTDHAEVLWLDHANPLTLNSLRRQGTSFVTSHGQVFLSAPGLYVDVRPARSITDPDRTRNPFSPRGRLVCVCLLLDPERMWTVSELANSASSSQSFVSRVLSSLRDQGLVEMNDFEVSPITEALFASLAENWPRPKAFYVGRVPTATETVIGGGPAYEKLGLTIPELPRAYVRDRDQLRQLVVRTGASSSTSRMADWEAVFQPLPLTNSIAPALICALELANDPRGREVLRNKQIVPWPIHG